MNTIADLWPRVQQALSMLAVADRPVLTDRHAELIVVLEVVRIEEHVLPVWWQHMGRRRLDRQAIGRAMIAKHYYNMPTTRALLDRLQVDQTLRRICGWERRWDVPSEATFSRAFAEFALTNLLDRVHESLVRKYLGRDIVWHVSRDSTAIEARERIVPKEAEEEEPELKYGRGRPKKNEVRPQKKPKRLELQLGQTPDEAVAQMPKECGVGVKPDSSGHKRYFKGYKLHVDVGDAGIPLTALTTSATVHDSQVAIPLCRLTAGRVTSWYDLMDSAYDAELIHQVSLEAGHVPIIDPQPKRNGNRELEPDRARRYRERTNSERFNSHLKDNCGGRTVRVRGHPKVHAHLMLGVLVVFALSWLGLIN